MERIKYNEKRNKEIYRRWLSGESYAILGEEYGLSLERCRVICKREIELERRDIPGIRRAADYLGISHSITESTIAAIKKNKLEKKWQVMSYENLIEYPGIGDVMATIITTAQDLPYISNEV